MDTVSLQSAMLCIHECHFVSDISQSNFCIFHKITESVIITTYTQSKDTWSERALPGGISVWIIRLQQSEAEYVSLTLTIDLLTPKSVGVFLSLSSICVCVWVIMLEQSVAEYVSLTLTFNFLTPNSKGVFFSLSYSCVWRLKSLGWQVVELLRYNKVWMWQNMSVWTWSFDPKIHRCLPFIVLHLSMKY